MNYRISVMCCIVSNMLCASDQKQESTSRVIIYNNHKITQTVTSSRDAYLNRNRYPGHTKNETATHHVDITPLDLQAEPFTSQGPATIDNAHIISQNATQTHDNLLPEEQLPTNNAHAYKPYMQSYSSWLAACLPPILWQSQGVRYILGGIGLFYAGFMAKLLYTSHYTIADNTTWSAWKSQMPLEAMRPHEKAVAQELFAAIQDFYIHAPINACFLSPLVHFINDIDAELNRLTTFISMHKIIEKLNLSFMFPQQQEALHIAHEKIERLGYFKHIVINWVGEYKA